jgi:hypothetical protein
MLPVRPHHAHQEGDDMRRQATGTASRCEHHFHIIHHWTTWRKPWTPKFIRWPLVTHAIYQCCLCGDRYHYTGGKKYMDYLGTVRR